MKTINGRILSCLAGAGWFRAAVIALFTLWAATDTARLQAEVIPSEPGGATFDGLVNLGEVARQEALQPPVLSKDKPPRPPHRPNYKPLPPWGG